MQMGGARAAIAAIGVSTGSARSSRHRSKTRPHPLAKWIGKMEVSKRVYDYVTGRGLPEWVIPYFGLYEANAGVGIPLTDPWGAQVGALVRTNSPGRRYCSDCEHTRTYPYALHQSKKQMHTLSYCVVTEGPFDVIAAVAAGIPTIGALGSYLSKSQAFWVTRYTTNAYIAYDRGTTEIENAKRTIKLLADYGVSSKIIDLPPGCSDLGETWERLDNPKAQLREWIADAHSS